MTKQLKILVVDDTPTNVKQLEVVARKLGHQVILAEDGLQAIQQYQAEAPDLVFMDIMMPRMDGLTAVQHIRELPAEKWTPIIFFSALDSVQDIVRGLELGGDDYLIKPANLQLMRAKINGYARVLEMQDKLRDYSRELAVWRGEAEQQLELGRHIINRLVDAKGLRDPMLRWLNIPAESFSGDLLCAARAPGDLLYAMLCDATGHGLSAALSSLPLTQVFYGMTAKGFPLRAIAEELNQKLKALMPADRFVAATLVAVDVRNQVIEVWNGGNPTALFLATDGSVLKRWESRSPPLGILAPSEFSGATETYKFSCSGDLVLYSDGVIEAEAPDGQRLNMDGLEALLGNARDGERFEALRLGLLDHMQGQQGHDDISCLMIRVPQERREAPRLDEVVPCAPGEAPLSEWRMDLSWGAQQLRSVDVVPAVLNMLGQLQILKAHQGTLFLILSELFNNALDHGVLGLDSRLKNQEGGFELYLRQREERLRSLTSGRVDMGFHVDMAGSQPMLNISVLDSGPGFDHVAMLTDKPSDGHELRQHGRGIFLVRSLCVELSYHGVGNRVLARLAL